ncbi:MAG: hypothetical protein Kow0089_22420 [Desulfobulbaceae bacterium]
MLSRSESRIILALLLSVGLHVFLFSRGGVTHRPPVLHDFRNRVPLRLFRYQAPPVAPEPVGKAPVKEEIPPFVAEVKPEKIIPVVEEKKPVPAPVAVKTPVADSGKTKVVEPVPAPEPVDARPAEQVVDPGTDSTTMEEAAETAVVVLARPLYRSNPPPAYPERARRKRQEGTVLLEVVVRADGSVESLRVEQGSGHRLLDRAALAAVRNWTFEPGRQAGVPVTMTVQVPVRFELE